MAVKSKSELFAELNASNKWDAGVTFYRTNGIPLDSKSIFTSLNDTGDATSLMEYVNHNPSAYAGQIVAVVNSGQSTAYVINDNGTVSEVGKTQEWGSLPS